MKRENQWNNYDAAELEVLEKVNAAYREYLDAGKTERECVTECIRLAEEAGYQSLESAIASGVNYRKAQKFTASAWENLSYCSSSEKSL